MKHANRAWMLGLGTVAILGAVSFPTASAESVGDLQVIDTIVNLGLQCRSQSGDVGLPVTGEVSLNGGSTFQLFQSPLTGNVYANWNLKTNNLDNGADEWAFGSQVSFFVPGENGGQRVARSYLVLHQFRFCEQIAGGVDLTGFDYFIDAGAAGWSGATSCTREFNWHVDVGVSISVKGPEATVEGGIGGSLACSDGTSYDSESLIRGGGHASPLCSGCIPILQGTVNAGSLAMMFTAIGGFVPGDGQGLPEYPNLLCTIGGITNDGCCSTPGWTFWDETDCSLRDRYNELQALLAEDVDGLPEYPQPGCIIGGTVFCCYGIQEDQFWTCFLRDTYNDVRDLTNPA